MNRQGYLHGYQDKLAFELEEPEENLRELPKDKLRNNPRLLKTWKALFEAGERIKNKKFDVKLPTGLNRVFLPTKSVDENVLGDIGFKESVIAVPEQGQSKWTTYRHPDTNFHLHQHDDGWYLHKDRFGALQMLLNKAVGKDVGAQAGAVATGTAHAVLEGIPGWWEYIKNGLSGGPTFKEKKEMGTDKADLLETVKNL